MKSLLSLTSSDLQPFLAHPEQLVTEPIEFQIAVANYPVTPRHFLEVLVNSPNAQVAEAAQLHVNWTGESTESWQKAVDEILRSRQLGQNDRLAVELLKLGPVPPCFFSEWVPAERLIQGLRNPYMPLRYRLQLLERLAQEETLEPRLQVAESPETPLPVLELLAGDLELPVRLAVKFNPSCPPPLIELVEGQHEIATDWDTNAEQLAMLGQSRWAWVRLAVAQNLSSPAQTLMQLAEDAILRIQLALAKNPATPADVLAVLAEHPDKAVQGLIAVHLKATEEILHQLFSTQQHLLKTRENLPVSILERFFNEAATDKPIWKNYELRNLLLRQPNTPTRILVELANVDLEALRREKRTTHKSPPSAEVFEQWIQDDLRLLADIAKHPQVSVAILEGLTQYSNPDVQLAVAQNSKTPEALKLQLLEALSINPDERIKVEIAQDFNTPVNILEHLVGALSSTNQMMETLRKINPDAPPPLLNRIRTFINNHQSPEQILFWLRQDAVFRAPILQEWNELVASLDELERQNLEAMGSMMLPAIGLGGGVPREDCAWLTQNLVDSSGKLSPTYILYGILLLIGLSYNSDRSNQAVVAALLGNPSTPTVLREHLWQQYKKTPDDFGRYLEDANLRMALAFNPTVPEAERIEYFQQLIETSNNVREKLAENPKTPPEILLQLMKQQGVGCQAVSRNPNAPANVLAELAQDSNSNTRRWLAENRGTPLNLLIRLAKDSDRGIRDTALKNPNMPLLERYRLLIAQEEEQETAKANELLARRPDSPYALAQVVEKGDRNAKLTAARSHKTPIPILEQLAKDADEKVRQAVAGNPSLPLNSLLELARSSVKVRSHLAYKPSHRKIPTPVQLLEILAQDDSEWVRAKVAEHPDTPVALLLRLANDSSREVKTKLTGNPNTPATVLMRLGLEENLVNRRNPNTPGEVLAQAVNHILRNPNQRDPRWSGLESTNKPLVEILKHPVKGSQMPASILEQLASHHYASVRYRVAQHPNTPTSALEKLARDTYVSTLRALVDNPNTPPHILEQLANTPDLTTRLSIARNPHTPARVLAQMVLSTQTSGNQPNRTVDTLKSAFPGDHNDLLRAIASNSRTPFEALAILARREFVSAAPNPQSIIPPTTDDDIVRSLAYNPSLTPELLSILTQDPCIDVRIALIHHPHLTETLWRRLAQDETVSVREAVAANTEVPAPVLELLARDEQTEVQVKVATNLKTAIAILESLADDENATVHTAVASNPHLPVAKLEQLANDEKVEVRRAVAQNPNTPAPIRETLRDLVLQPQKQTSPTLLGLNRLYNPNTDDLATVISEYARSDNAFVRLVTLLHPLTPGEILQQGSQSESWLERYAVADNPATTSEIRQQLAQDSNRIVRAAARVYLETDEG